MRYYDPTRGRILFDGIPITELIRAPIAPGSALCRRTR